MLTLKEKFEVDRAIVGLSGGPDSMALLHLLNNNSEVQLQAIHVNYGVSPNSNNWEKLCEEYCAELNVPFKSYRVNIGTKNFESRAREERLKIFSTNGFSNNVFLGHHLDDQIETFFLKLKSGNGLRGLKAMNRIVKLKDLVIFRPLLSYTKEEIIEYVTYHNIPYVTDESNNDLKYDRNFIRHKVIPLFEERFPNFRRTMEKTVFSLNDSKFCLDDLAEMDLDQVMEYSKNLETPFPEKISIEKIRILDLAPQRIRNMLQYYLNSKNFSTSYNDLIHFSNSLMRGITYNNRLEMSLKSKFTDKRYCLKQEGKYLSIVEYEPDSRKRKSK